MRVKKALKNTFFSVMSQVIIIFAGFFSQRVMNLKMGEELIGMNSVISNIIALLSVTELGISTAVVFHLYGALAEGDERKTASLMNLYRKAYCIFAAVITLLGICVMPFVHIFLKENSFSLGYIRLIYGLWLLRTVLSYLLSYKRSILIADQREYIVSIGTLIASTLNYLLIIVVLEVCQNYVLALLLNTLVEVILNVILGMYVGKKYSYLKKYRRLPLEKEIIRSVAGDIKNIFVTRLSTKLLVSTDNLLISGLISVKIVGLYANYRLITQSLINIVTAFSNAIQPTVGNLFVEGDHQKEYGVLRQVTFLFFLGGSFAAASLMALLTPFVSDVWLGAEYALDRNIVIGCVVNFFMLTMGMPLSMMMGVTGLFKKERNLSVLSALANFALSLALIFRLEVVGVQIGTFAAYLIQIVYRIYVLVRQYMGQNWKRYVLDLLEYSAVAAAETLLVCQCRLWVYESGNVLAFLAVMAICVIIPNGLNLLLYRRTWRLKSVIGMIKQIKR